MVVTHYFPPEVGAPQARFSQLAGGLAERGLEVTVHTCPPHYPEGRIQPPYRNRSGRRSGWAACGWFGARVLAAPNRGTARRLADHATFAATAVATAGRAGPADAVVVESPPLFLAAAGVAYARRLRAPLVLNVADLWPDSAVELGALTNRRAIQAARSLERLAYRNAAAITAPTVGIVETLEATAGEWGKGDPHAAVRRRRALRCRPGLEAARDRFGSCMRGPREWRRVWTCCSRPRASPVPRPCTCELPGEGRRSRRCAPAPRAYPNVEMLGVRPSAEIPGLYREADAAVVLLRDAPLFRGALPTKMYEAMAAGRPLVLAAAGESAHLVAGAGSGVVVPPEDPGELAGAFLRLAETGAPELRDMGEAGRRTAAEHDLGQAVERWVQLLHKVAALTALEALEVPRMGD